MKTYFSEEKLIKQFETPFQLTPYFWPTLSWPPTPFFFQILKIRTS